MPTNFSAKFDMTSFEKNVFYDRLCILLTDYEMPEEGQDPVTEDDLYEMLVEIQNNWDELLGDGE